MLPNAAAAAAAQVVQVACAFLVAAFALRELGAASYGLFALVASLVLLINLLDAAVGVSVTRAAAAARSTNGAASADVAYLFAVQYVLVRVAAGLGVCAAVLGLVGFSMRSELQCLVATMLAAVAVSTFGSTWQATAAGLQRYTLVAIAMSVGAAVNLAVVFSATQHLGVSALGLGLLLSAISNRTCLFLVMGREPWLSVVGTKTDNTYRQVLRQSGPLALVLGASQVVSAANLVALGALVSLAAVGVFRLALLVVTQSISLLYRAYDVSLPRLSSHREGTAQLDDVRRLTRLSSLVAGLGLGAVACDAGSVMQVLADTSDAQARIVLLTLCLGYSLAVPAHGFSLLVIARRQQRVLGRFAMYEAALNVSLTIGLAAAVGAVGAALGLALSLAISNLVVLPLLLGRHAQLEVASQLWWDGVFRVAGGLGCAAVAAALTQQLMPEGLPRLAFSLMLSLLPALALAKPLLGSQLTSRLYRHGRSRQHEHMNVDS